MMCHVGIVVIVVIMQVSVKSIYKAYLKLLVVLNILAVFLLGRGDAEHGADTTAIRFGALQTKAQGSIARRHIVAI